MLTKEIEDMLKVLRSELMVLIEFRRSDFEFHYVIGRGGFGKVWKVRMLFNNEYYAMKEMDKAKIIQKRSVNSILSEQKLLAQLRHPFLINMSYAFQDKENLYLAMDYLEGGDLRYHIKKKRNFNEKESSKP